MHVNGHMSVTRRGSSDVACGTNAELPGICLTKESREWTPPSHLCFFKMLKSVVILFSELLLPILTAFVLLIRILGALGGVGLKVVFFGIFDGSRET